MFVWDVSLVGPSCYIDTQNQLRMIRLPASFTQTVLFNFNQWKPSEKMTPPPPFFSIVVASLISQANHFVVIDMSTDGGGEWQLFNYSAFFGAPFIWTTLHDFGGDDGMKGDLARINQIPFAALTQEHPTNVWGTGYISLTGIVQLSCVYILLLTT
jgi:hypothetical protein